MNKHFPDGDTEPWYRQFWPWVLILLPASVVVASLYTLYLANRHADDLVVDEYYKNGLAINRQLERKQRAEARGISTTLLFSDGFVTAVITGEVTDPQLQLLLSHPLEADRDFAVPLVQIEPGTYRGSLPHPVIPRWHWTLQQLGPEGWRLDGSVDQADMDDGGLD